MDYNPIETMINSMPPGANIELKQRLPDGTYQPAPTGTLESIGKQAKLAAVANAISDLTFEEKTQWAIQKRNDANELYANKEFEEAIQMYLECLTATEFGKKNDNKVENMNPEQVNGNIDQVVVPVLCNLAACCIQIKDWGKVIKFCDQCLLLRSNCSKALIRRGMAYFHIGEFKLSINDLNQASTLGQSIGDKLEQEKIKLYLNRAENGLLEQNKSIVKRKQALQKAFNGPEVVDDRTVLGDNHKAISTTATTTTTTEMNQNKNKEWNRRDVVSVVILISIVLIAIFVSRISITKSE